MHPSAELKGTLSDKLMGKKIILGVTGGIGAVENVKMTHELIRHGAEVFPVLTEAATRIIHPDALWAASGKKPITVLTGEAEHVTYCGDVEDKADLLLIAPATANTISKIAMGIGDNPVTTFALTAIGTGIPVIILPAMHRTMYENPFLQKNLEILQDQEADIEIIMPRFEEGKAKVADIHEIASRVIRRLWKPDLENKRVLVIAGSTSEQLDEFRVLSNRSTGKMGIELAAAAFLRGADVTLWYGSSPETPPAHINTERFTTVDDIFAKISFLNYDITIVCAAISDYSPEKMPGKIPSGKEELLITLKPVPKVISAVRSADPKAYLVGFKAEFDVDEHALIDKAFSRLKTLELQMIVANDLKEVTKDENHVFILRASGARREASGSKIEISEIIFNEIVDDLRSAEGIEINREQ
jgi:phosphopantothenoylcysteine decarboxylase/phosphopantothenate--cysteine ligase